MRTFHFLPPMLALLTACGGDTAATAPVAPPPAAPPPAPKFIDPLPEGCPAANELTIASDKVSSFEVKQAWYVTWAGVEGSLVFTNYDDLDPASLYAHTLVDGEALVVIKLANADNSPVGVGVYESSWGKDPKPAKQARELNLSTPALAGGVFDDKGTVEITYFGTDVVCGKLQADDGKSKMTGQFITRYKKVQ